MNERYVCSVTRLLLRPDEVGMGEDPDRAAIVTCNCHDRGVTHVHQVDVIEPVTVDGKRRLRLVRRGP